MSCPELAPGLTSKDYVLNVGSRPSLRVHSGYRCCFGALWPFDLWVNVLTVPARPLWTWSRVALLIDTIGRSNRTGPGQRGKTALSSLIKIFKKCRCRRFSKSDAVWNLILSCSVHVITHDNRLHMRECLKSFLVVARATGPQSRMPAGIRQRSSHTRFNCSCLSVILEADGSILKPVRAWV